MKGRVVVLGQINRRRAAALIVDGELHDFLIEPADATAPLPGAIYRAVADRPLKGQGGMMLRLPHGMAFLRQGKGIHPGQALLVHVTGYADEGKAVPVSPKLLFKSRYSIVTPDAPGLNISRSIKDEDERERLLAIAHSEMDETEGFGLILRSAAAGMPEEEVANDIADMRDQASGVMDAAGGTQPALLLEGPDPHLLAWRDWEAPDQVVTSDNGFEELGVLELLEPFCHAFGALSGGASLYVEPTRALVAVDVNTGGDTSPAAGLKANIAAARALPQHLRIRGLGGQIVVDFAPMAKKDRRQLESSLRAAFRSDPIETSLVGWTPLGHYELQRKRERQPQLENLKL